MLNPEHILARSRLAMTHEKLGHKQQAVTEYLAVASLLQRGGNLEKATQLVERTLKMAPSSAEVQTFSRRQSSAAGFQLLPR